MHSSPVSVSSIYLPYIRSCHILIVAFFGYGNGNGFLQEIQNVVSISTQ